MIFYQLVFFFAIFTSSFAYAIELPLLPLQNIEADSIDYSGKTITLIGNVQLIHNLGNLQCDRGILYLSAAKEANQEIPIDTIFLQGNVHIRYSDGSDLTCDEADINCQTLEGIFTANPPSKVVYSSFAQEKDHKIPIRASGKILKGSIIKSPQGYTLSSLKGEGAVAIEYMYNNPVSLVHNSPS